LKLARSYILLLKYGKFTIIEKIAGLAIRSPMDEFKLLEDYFNHMVGKTIVGVGVIEDELVLSLDDGSKVTIFSDDDISMNIVYTN
jgi:hypothetical protein